MTTIIMSAFRKTLTIVSPGCIVSSIAHADVIVETRAGHLRSHKHETRDVMVVRLVHNGYNPGGVRRFRQAQPQAHWYWPDYIPEACTAMAFEVLSKVQNNLRSPEWLAHEQAEIR